MDMADSSFEVDTDDLTDVEIDDDDFLNDYFDEVWGWKDSDNEDDIDDDDDY